MRAPEGERVERSPAQGATGASRPSLRILHVVTALAPDDRFGGPPIVALGLAAASQAAGQTVRLGGAAVGFRRVPKRIDGVPVLLRRGWNPLPALGAAALVAPGLLPRLRPWMRRADVVHVHLGRDLVSLPAALLARALGRPYVLQTHGMVDASERRLARLIDAVGTRRAIEGAAAVLTLTAAEDEEVRRLVPGARVRRFGNGVALPESVPEALSASAPVLFLARLHPRKGAVLFARTAKAFVADHPAARFEIVGPDEGDGPEILRLVHDEPRIRLRGAVPNAEARRRLASCLVYVLPADREPFGMTVIEAMAGGRPVILASSAELAPTVVAAGAGWTFGPDGLFPDLESALRHVLADAADRERAADRARRLAAERFSINAVVAELQQIYGDAREERRGEKRSGG